MISRSYFKTLQKKVATSSGLGTSKFVHVVAEIYVPLCNGYVNAGITDENLCAAYIKISNMLSERQLCFYSGRLIGLQMCTLHLNTDMIYACY